MVIFASHHRRDRVIAAVQRAHRELHPDDVAVRKRMVDTFEAYLRPKSPAKFLFKAQMLQTHHFSNRIRAEKDNFTQSLFDVCATHFPQFAAARPLAALCEIVPLLARDQAIADGIERGGDIAALEEAYTAVFARERVAEALVFFLARTLPLEELQGCVADLTHPLLVQARKRVTALLQDTPEARPLGIDLLGRSAASDGIEHTPQGPLPQVDLTIEEKARALLEATWSPPVSQAGMLALCRGLKHPELDVLLAAQHPALFEACKTFTDTLPGVKHIALDWGLAEALRDVTGSARRRSCAETPAPLPT